jgi:hypothetical protein
MTIGTITRYEDPKESSKERYRVHWFEFHGSNRHLRMKGFPTQDDADAFTPEVES